MSKTTKTTTKTGEPKTVKPKVAEVIFTPLPPGELGDGCRTIPLYPQPPAPTPTTK